MHTLITGGGSGMGRIAAERFVAEGARVVVVDYNADNVPAYTTHPEDVPVFPLLYAPYLTPAESVPLEERPLRRVQTFDNRGFVDRLTARSPAGVDRSRTLKRPALSGSVQLLGLKSLPIDSGSRRSARTRRRPACRSLCRRCGGGSRFPARPASRATAIPRPATRCSNRGLNASPITVYPTTTRAPPPRSARPACPSGWRRGLPKGAE